MKLVFSTANKAKLREAREILGNEFEISIPADFGLYEDVQETGETLKENSLIKAEYIYEKLGCDCFADDSGLEVDILGGEPGVHSARYSGEDKDFNSNMDKLLKEMSLKEYEASVAREYGFSTKFSTRKARFKTVISLILNGEKHFFEGVMEGRIGRIKSGEGGFGYDPIFIPDELPAIGENGEILYCRPTEINTAGLTAAEITEGQKNAISHRGKAIRAMAEFLKKKQ